MDIKANISNRPLRAKIGSQLKQPRGKQKRSQSRMPVIVARFDQRRAVAPATPTRRTNAKGSRIPGCEHGLRHAGRAAHADGRAKQDACSARACASARVKARRPFRACWTRNTIELAYSPPTESTATTLARGFPAMCDPSVISLSIHHARPDAPK